MQVSYINICHLPPPTIAVISFILFGGTTRSPLLLSKPVFEYMASRIIKWQEVSYKRLAIILTSLFFVILFEQLIGVVIRVIILLVACRQLFFSSGMMMSPHLRIILLKISLYHIIRCKQRYSSLNDSNHYTKLFVKFHFTNLICLCSN